MSMDPFAVLGAAQFAIGALTAGYEIYKRIQGADEKIDDAGTEIETNLSFLKEHLSYARADLSSETLKRIDIRLKSISDAAEEAEGILKLWEVFHSKRVYRKAFQVGSLPGRLEDLSDKIEKNIERLRREFSGLAGGMTATSNHTAVVHGAPPSGPTGISPSVGFQPILPSRPSDPYTVSGNFNNPVSFLSSSAPPIASAPGGPGMSGYSQPHNLSAHPITMNSNAQFNNQPPHSSYSRPPLHHSSTTVPLVMPPHQQPNAPLQNAPPPGYQHQRVGNSSSCPQPSSQPGVPSTQWLPPKGSNPMYSSVNVNEYATAQPPLPYGVPVPSVHVANRAPAPPAPSQPSQGTSHHPSNIPGQPQNCQNQPHQRQSHLGNPPTQPSYQPQAPHGTGQRMYVPPPMQRPQIGRNAHSQIPNSAQRAAGVAQTSNQPQVPGTGHMSAPPPNTRPQGFQKPQMQMANNAQLGGFAQPSNQPQVPRTRYMPPPPPIKQSQGLQTTQFLNNAQLGGSSAQPAPQPQVPGPGYISAPPPTRPPQGPLMMQLSNEKSMVGSSTQSAHQRVVPRPTTQMPHTSAATRIQVPKQNQFPNNALSGQGPPHPQTSYSLPNSRIVGVSQHHSGPAAYVSGGMSNIPSTSTQSPPPAQHNPTGWIGNTNHALRNLSLGIGGGTGVQHRNSFSGMPGNGLQPGSQKKAPIQ